jgi:uncharacterized protein (TIGR02466 family)
MIKSTVTGLFPTPIYFSKLERQLNKKELIFVNKNKSDVCPNGSSTTSNNNYILNNKIFKNLKNELNLRVQDYFDKIICTKNNITPYITQSWLNYTEENQHLNIHSHGNSIVSGVFYINSDEKIDSIKFFSKLPTDTIVFDIKEWNIWNSASWFFPVKTGDIVIFPSSLKHMVENKKGKNTRISLAFNVFVKGTVGNNKDLTELIL